ncbi:MAG TPA: aspartate aminotransferase family protein [Bacteroidales bacterium]
MLTERELFFRHLAPTSDAPLALEIERAEGIYLFGPKGKSYVDLISGISVSSVGHLHPHVVKAVTGQLGKYMHLMVFGEYIQSPQVRLAEKLASVLPPNLQSCYFVNSGSEAIEGALKLAKRFTGRSKICSFLNAYHGSSHGALSVMGNESFKRAYRPLLPDVHQLEFNNLKDLAGIDNHTACVLIEPVQGEAGVITATQEFLDALRKRCNDTGALLIFDEIQTGFGRTGKLFAFEHYDVIPDIITFAKAMGGGMPIGAFISTPAIMNSLSHSPALGHITSFGGHPVSCAAALATIEVLLDENLVAQVKEKELLFIELLSDHLLVKEIRSCGLLMALELPDFNTNKRVIDKTIEKGVITDWFLFNSKSMRIAPPLIITKEQITTACKTIREAMDEVLAGY